MRHLCDISSVTGPGEDPGHQPAPHYRRASVSRLPPRLRDEKLRGNGETGRRASAGMTGYHLELPGDRRSRGGAGQFPREQHIPVRGGRDQGAHVPLDRQPRRDRRHRHHGDRESTAGRRLHQERGAHLRGVERHRSTADGGVLRRHPPDRRARQDGDQWRHQLVGRQRDWRPGRRDHLVVGHVDEREPQEREPRLCEPDQPSASPTSPVRARPAPARPARRRRRRHRPVTSAPGEC